MSTLFVSLLAAIASVGVSVFLPVPQNLKTTFEDGQSLYALGEYKGAIQSYNKVVRFHSRAVRDDSVRVNFGEDLDLPVKVAAWYQLGNAYKKNGQYDEAVEAYRHVFENRVIGGEFRATVQFQIADTRFFQENFEEAAKEYRSFIATFPKSGQVGKAYLYAGWSLFKLARYDDAITALEEMLSRYPDNLYAPDARFRVASSYFEKGDYAQAISEAGRTMAEYPKSPIIGNAQYLEAVSFDKLGRVDDAIASYQKVIDLYDPMYELLRGSFREGKNVDFDEYVKLFESSFLKIAEIFRDKKGDYERSYQTYFAAQERVKDMETKARIQVLIGDNYMAWQKYQEAEKAYALTITNYPSTSYPPSAQYKVAEARYMAKDYEGARNEYLAVLEKFPDTDTELKAASVYNAAWCLESLARPLDAVATYQRVTVDFPRSPQAPLAHLRIGKIDFDNKDFASAVGQYKEVIGRLGEEAIAQASDPAQARKMRGDAYYYLGLASKELGDSEGAIAAFTSVQKDAGLTFVGAQMALAQLYNGLKRPSDARGAVQKLLQEVQGDKELEPLADYQMGQLSLAERDYSDAVNWYSIVVDKFVDSDYLYDALYGRASARYALGSFKEAAVDYERLVAGSSPEGLKLRGKLGLALAYSGTGREREANELLRDVASSGDKELARTARIQQVSLAEKESPAAVIASYTTLLGEAEGDQEIRQLILPRLANAYYRQERYEDALKTALQVLSAGGNPESLASARFLVGNSYFKLASKDRSQESQLLPKALEQYERIVNESPKNLIASEALFQIGVVYNKLGLTVESGIEKSIDAFTRYSKQYQQGENAPYALYYAAWGHYRLGAWDKAGSLFDDFVSRFPGHDLASESLFRAGEALFNNKRFTEAIVHFQRLVTAYPKSQYVDAALYSHAWSLINLHREAEAVPVFQRIVAEHPSGKYGAQSQFTLGDYYYGIQQYDKASAEYRRFVGMYPNERVMTPRAQLLLGNLAEIDAYSIYEKGTQLFDQNKYNDAMDIFKEVVQRYPTSKTAVNARLNIAAAYQATERYDKSRDEYLSFLKDYQSNSELSQQVEFARAQLEELKKVL